MDANESDAVMLEVLGELRRLNEGLCRIGDTMLLVSQTCTRATETMERLDARMALIPGPAE